jgi:hypothetical protein
LRKSYRLLLATVCALIAGALTFVMQQNRDFLFESRWHEPDGQFDAREDKTLMEEALKVAQEEMRGTTCVGEWVGKDERYVYVTMGCGIFKQEGNKIVVSGGDRNYRPVRLERNGFELRRAEVVDSANFLNSVRRLFPKVAADMLAVRMNAELYKERGLAKQLGKAPPPPPAPAPAPGPVIPAK